MEEVRSHPRLEVIGEPARLLFDADGSLGEISWTGAGAAAPRPAR